MKGIKGEKEFWVSLNQLQQISHSSKDWRINAVILLTCVVYKSRKQMGELYVCE